MAANTIPLHCQTDRLAKILIEKTQLDNIGILLTDRLNYPLRYRLSFAMRPIMFACVFCTTKLQRDFHEYSTEENILNDI